MPTKLTSDLIKKLREIFPDGNFLLHGTAHHIERQKRLQEETAKYRLKSPMRILKSGFIISQIAAIEQGREIRRVAYTEPLQVSFTFNFIPQWGDIIFMFPLVSVLGRGVTLVAGTDKLEIRLIPEGAEKLDEDDETKLFTAVLCYQTCGPYFSPERTLQFYEDFKKNKEALIKSTREGLEYYSSERERYERDLKRHLEGYENQWKSFETFLRYQQDVGLEEARDVNSWKDIGLDVAHNNVHTATWNAIMGFVLKKKFDGKLTTKNWKDVYKACEVFSVELALNVIKSFGFEKAMIPVEKSIMLVPDEQYDYWKRFAEKHGHKPKLILGYGRLPRYNNDSKSFVLSVKNIIRPQISDEVTWKVAKVEGKFSITGKCTGYMAYDSMGKLIYEFNLGKSAQEPRRPVKGARNDFGKKAELVRERVAEKARKKEETVRKRARKNVEKETEKVKKRAKAA